MKRKILIVDDSDISRDVLAFTFEDSFTCDLATNGEEAIEHLKKSEYDCVFLDIIMPVVDGFGVLEFMNKYYVKDSAAKRPPVIVLTSISEEGMREKCLAAGALEFLNKPFKREEIYGVLKKAGIRGVMSAE